MEHKKRSKWISLCYFLVLCFLIQVVGSVFTTSTVSTWYPSLHKASWTPPAWVFGPVWTLLYIMIAVSGWLIYLKPVSDRRKKALTLYGIQLAFNFLWSFLFFYLKSPALGLLDILLLVFVTGWSVFVFWRISRMASLLFVPYFLWTAYAATLNGAIWILNKT